MSSEFVVETMCPQGLFIAAKKSTEDSRVSGAGASGCSSPKEGPGWWSCAETRAVKMM